MSCVHSRVWPTLLFLAVMFAFGAQNLQAQITHIVGTCMTGTTFTTIQKALNTPPFPNTVEVCPGTYKEQVHITRPVTLEGISSNNNDKAIILPPSGGLVVNAGEAFDSLGVAAQVFVQVATSVNLSNLIIDGTGNRISNVEDYIVGILYEDTSGTVNGVTTRNQEGNGNGVGIWLEGGTFLPPSVTVEHCTIHGYDHTGILTEASFPGVVGSLVTATINQNFVYGHSTKPTPASALHLFYGSTVTATNNYVGIGPSGYGVFLAGAAGNVSGNTIVGGTDSVGVEVAIDGAISINSNNFSAGLGGVIWTTRTQSTAVQNNLIVRAKYGLEFNCNSANGLAYSNTIIETDTGVDRIPAGTASANTYFGVATEATSCP